MKEGWTMKALNACIENVKIGTKLPSSSYKESGLYPIISQEKEFISGYWNDAKDLYLHTTPVTIFGDHTMVVKYVDFNFVIGADGVKILVPKPFLNPKYFFYWVSSIKINNHGYARHYRYLKEQLIPYPASLAEQQRIVEILDAEFAKIDVLRANTTKSLQAAKDLFQSALKQELQPKEGWVNDTISNISENLDYKRVPITKKDRDCGIYPYYGASGIVDYVSEYLFDEDLLLISEDGANLVARSTPIAFSISGKVWVNNHAHVLRFPSIELQRFVEYFFANYDLSSYITGTAQPKLTQKALNSIIIKYPPTLAEQTRIVSRLDQLNERCKTLQENYDRTITLCEDLKQALLRKAFNGEL